LENTYPFFINTVYSVTHSNEILSKEYLTDLQNKKARQMNDGLNQYGIV